MILLAGIYYPEGYNIWCWPVGSGEVWGYRTDPAFSPKVQAGVTPSVKADGPNHQWNTFHIVMKAGRLHRFAASEARGWQLQVPQVVVFCACYGSEIA